MSMASTSVTVDWAKRWETGEDADLTLQLTVQDHTDSLQCKDVHKAFLKSASEYFRSRLTNQLGLKGHGPMKFAGTAAVAKGSNKGKQRQKAVLQASEQTDGPSLILTLECESVEDQAACLAALTHAYTGELPPAEGNTSFLAMVCRKADYWQMPATVEACLAALSKLAEQPQCSTETCSLLLSLLPEQLLSSSDTGKALLQQLYTAATRRFANAVDVINDKQLQQQFVALPFELVLHWARQDTLITDSENTVAVLMHLWCKHHQKRGLKASGGPAERLSRLLRIPQLSFPFHLHALPKLPWYIPPPELSKEHALVQLGHKTLQDVPDYMETLSDFGWSTPRTCSGGVTIEWALNTVQLQEAWASTEKVFDGPRAYYAGYTCTLSAEAFLEDNGKQLDVYVDCKYCQELSPWCTGPIYAAMEVTLEIGQGGGLHHTKTSSHVFEEEAWGRGRVLTGSGLQHLLAYRELPIQVTLKTVKY